MDNLIFSTKTLVFDWNNRFVHQTIFQLKNRFSDEHLIFSLNNCIVVKASFIKQINFSMKHLFIENIYFFNGKSILQWKVNCFIETIDLFIKNRFSYWKIDFLMNINFFHWTHLLLCKHLFFHRTSYFFNEKLSFHWTNIIFNGTINFGIESIHCSMNKFICSMQTVILSIEIWKMGN